MNGEMKSAAAGNVEDLEAMNMANIPSEREFQRKLEESCTKVCDSVCKDRKRRAMLVTLGKLLWCVVIAMALVSLAVAGQVAGWIANVGVGACMVAGALVMDRRLRRK